MRICTCVNTLTSWIHFPPGKIFVTNCISNCNYSRLSHFYFFLLSFNFSFTQTPSPLLFATSNYFSRFALSFFQIAIINIYVYLAIHHEVAVPTACQNNTGCVLLLFSLFCHHRFLSENKISDSCCY